jgi:hypothetical protein
MQFGKAENKPPLSFLRVTHTLTKARGVGACWADAYASAARRPAHNHSRAVVQGRRTVLDDLIKLHSLTQPGSTSGICMSPVLKSSNSCFCAFEQSP